MLPKIVLAKGITKKDFYIQEFLNENDVLALDGSDTNVEDLREWVVFCQNVSDEVGTYSQVIWNADELSAECQSILLKPLEEKKSATRFYLLVDKETDLLPTIVSRCEVVKEERGKEVNKYWKDLIRLWRLGAGEMVSFGEKFNSDELESLLREVIEKVKKELVNGVNKKRLLILRISMAVLAEIKNTNVNKRMALESFLFRSLQAINS